MIATQVPRRLSLLKTSSTRASLVIPAAHWAETITVPAVGEVLRRDRQDAMDGPWQTLIGLLGQPATALTVKSGLLLGPEAQSFQNPSKRSELSSVYRAPCA